MLSLRQAKFSPTNEWWDPRSAYDQAASGYDDWPWQKVWRSVERSQIEKALQDHTIGSVLDVGCGTGSLLRRINDIAGGEAELVGVDVSNGMLGQARLKCVGKPIRFIHSDLLECALPRRHFDFVFMCRVASHLPDLSPYFSAVSRLIKSDGIFVLSDVHNGHPYECTRLPFAGHKIPVATYKHSPAEIVSIAAEAALVAVSWVNYGPDDLSNELRKDPELPTSLREQLHSGNPTPFGFLTAFQLAHNEVSEDCQRASALYR